MGGIQEFGQVIATCEPGGALKQTPGSTDDGASRPTVAKQMRGVALHGNPGVEPLGNRAKGGELAGVREARTVLRSFGMGGIGARGHARQSMPISRNIAIAKGAVPRAPGNEVRLPKDQTSGGFSPPGEHPDKTGAIMLCANREGNE